MWDKLWTPELGRTDDSHVHLHSTIICAQCHDLINRLPSVAADHTGGFEIWKFAALVLSAPSHYEGIVCLLGRPVWLQLRLMGHLAAGAVRRRWDSFARKMPHTISSAALAAALSSPQTACKDMVMVVGIDGDGSLP